MSTEQKGKRRMDEFIKCADRMPEEDGPEVMVRDASGNEAIASYHDIGWLVLADENLRDPLSGEIVEWREAPEWHRARNGL